MLCKLRLLSFIISSYYFIAICTNFPFCLPLCHWQSTPPQTWACIRKSNTQYIRTADKAITTIEPLRQSLRFQIHICCQAWHSLQRSPTYPPNSSIHFHHHCQCHSWWWLTIVAYTMSLLLFLIKSVCMTPPHPPWSISRDPPPYALSDKIAMYLESPPSI